MCAALETLFVIGLIILLFPFEAAELGGSEGPVILVGLIMLTLLYWGLAMRLLFRLARQWFSGEALS